MAAKPARPDSGWPIAEVAVMLGVSSGASDVAVCTWLDVLTDWNAKMDLTAAKDPRALVWLMLADAWMLTRVVPKGASVVDVGTGAGAPGLALAIARPDLHVTLVEPLAKRAAFLRTVIGTLGRLDIALHARDAHALAPAQYDVAMSRATFPPGDWLALGKTLVREGGSVWVFLAQDEPPIAEGATLVETLTYDEPAERLARKRLVRYVVGA